jgi:hypothetical protein
MIANAAKEATTKPQLEWNISLQTPGLPGDWRNVLLQI